MKINENNKQTNGRTPEQIKAMIGTMITKFNDLEVFKMRKLILTYVKAKVPEREPNMFESVQDISKIPMVDGWLVQISTATNLIMVRRTITAQNDEALYALLKAIEYDLLNLGLQLAESLAEEMNHLRNSTNIAQA